MELSRDWTSKDAITDKNPITRDNPVRKINYRHQTLVGNKLKKVINMKQITKLILQKGPAQIGVIRKINTAIIFNLLSIIRNQLLFPSTYCPIENFVRIFINLSE